MHRLFRWEGYAVALALTTTIALAETPTFAVKGIHCQGRACKAIVVNDAGLGVEILGAKRAKVLALAEAKAAELNAAVQLPAGLTDICPENSTLCAEAGI